MSKLHENFQDNFDFMLVLLVEVKAKTWGSSANVETRAQAGRPGLNSRQGNNGIFPLCHRVQTETGAHPA